MGIFDFILHIDSYLAQFIDQLGALSYGLLFLIVFAETGLVVTPFLPGDSLLFAAGALAGGGFLEVWILLPVLFVAAVAGDTVNYWIGNKFGTRAFRKENARFLKPGYLAQTQAFYAKHGGKTIVLARFVPIVRTFAPFVAGVGSMRYGTFLLYNVVGAFVWVVSLTLAGFFFGSIPVVKENFEYVVFLIVLLSVVPPFVEYLKHRRSATRGRTSYRAVKKVVEKK